MRKKRVAIVGAGVAGLTAAATLAGRADVDVFERAERAGGKVRQVRWGERSVDCGPTVFTMRAVFDEVFAACGERFDDHIRIKPLEVLARHAWPDGSQLDLYADQQRTADAIDAFAGPKEADAYRGFLNMAERTWDAVYKPFIRQPRPSLSAMVFGVPPQQLLRRDPYVCMWRELSLRFQDERLKQLFARYTTYCGSSPFKAPSTLALIAHLEQEGVWTIEGGMGRLVEALTMLAEKRGARFHYDTPVSQITAQGGRVVGLGPLGAADIVIYNGDSGALRPDGSITQGPGDDARTPPSKRSQSAVTLSFLGRSEGMAPSVHNVLFSSDYRAEFDQIFREHRVPREPTVYTFAPDAGGDQQGMQRFFCLINAPADGDTHTYSKEEEQQCQTRILNQASACGLTLLPKTGTKVTMTPSLFAQRFPGTGGALFGQPLHDIMASFRRPGVRTRTKGLYRAGGSVHPGSGVPMTALSGFMAAQAIIKDYALTSASTKTATPGGISTPSAIRPATG